MEYSELIAARYSVRAYRPEPVEKVLFLYLFFSGINW